MRGKEEISNWLILGSTVCCVLCYAWACHSSINLSKPYWTPGQCITSCIPKPSSTNSYDKHRDWFCSRKMVNASLWRRKVSTLTYNSCLWIWTKTVIQMIEWKRIWLFEPINCTMFIVTKSLIIRHGKWVEAEQQLLFQQRLLLCPCPSCSMEEQASLHCNMSYWQRGLHLALLL